MSFFRDQIARSLGAMRDAQSQAAEKIAAPLVEGILKSAWEILAPSSDRRGFTPERGAR